MSPLTRDPHGLVSIAGVAALLTDFAAIDSADWVVAEALVPDLAGGQFLCVIS